MFSIVIPVKNDPRLANCLEKIRSQDFSQYEIIVVENGVKERALLDLPEDIHILHRKEAGAFGARNEAIKVAKNEIIAFIDADCLPEYNWLSEAKKYFEKNSNCSLMAGKISCYGKKESLNSYEAYEGLCYLDQEHYVFERDFAATANFFVRKEVFEKVGLFGGNANAEEEREWCSRAKKYGFELHYNEHSCVTHPLRSSLGAITSATIRDASAQLYYKKMKVDYLDDFWLKKLQSFCTYLLKAYRCNDLSVFKKIRVSLVIIYVSIINLLVRLLPLNRIIEWEKR